MSQPHEARQILIVDDESHILHVVSFKLRNAGFRVHTAGDGEEGYELALRIVPDLIITDYQMPFMSGVELCRKLRQTPQTADIPALMLTARGFTLDPEELKQTYVVAVLSKPFSPREVLAKVLQLTGGRLVQQA